MSKSVLDIRIGTLVPASRNSGNYIRQVKRHGFESFSLTFWQEIGQVNIKTLATEVQDAIGGDDIKINCIAVFGNPLESRPINRRTIEAWKTIIDHAHLFGATVVAGFAGRLIDKPVPDSLRQFKKVFGPLARRAADKGVRIAFENCDMGGDWQRGDWNIAHAPTAWELMFHELPADNIGLEWEPCHQLNSLIDPIPQLKKWVNKIFHIHGKDATVMWDVVRTVGIRGGQPYVFHRTPGFGDTNWTDVISILRMNGWRGSIDIEGWHDPVYRGDLEMTGQVHALQYLKRCRGGEFVPNPT